METIKMPHKVEVSMKGENMPEMERSVDNTFVGGGNPYAYGGGYGMGMGGFGSAFLGGVIGGSIVSRRGLFGGGDGCCDTGHGNGFANWSKLESIENQIQTGNVTDQFNALHVNVNQGFRDTTIQNIGLQRDICDLGSKVDMQTLVLQRDITSGTQAILDRMCADKISTLEHNNVILANELALEKKMPGTFVAGQVSTAPMCTARDNDNIALLLAQNNANSLNLAFNSGIQAGAFGQGQAAGQGIGQGAFQH